MEKVVGRMAQYSKDLKSTYHMDILSGGVGVLSRISASGVEEIARLNLSRFNEEQRAAGFIVACQMAERE